MNTTNALAVIITTLRAIAESTYALAADHVGALKLLRELRNSGVAPGCATDEWIRATRLNYIRYCSPEPYHSARLTEQLAAVRVAIEEGLAISEADVEVPAADDEEYPAAFLAAVEAVLAMPDAAVLGGDGVGGVRCALWGETRRLTHEPFGSLGATARTWADQYSSWSRAPLDDAKADDDLREATEALRAAYVAYREQHAVARGPNDLLEQLDAERAARLVAEQGLAEIRKVLGANDDDDGDGEYESTHAAARRAIEVRNVWQTRWNEAADKLGAVRNALGASLSDDIVGKARHLTERLALAERKAQDLDETRAVLGASPNESTVEAARRQVDRIADGDREIAQLRTTMADQTSAYEAGAAQHGERFKEIEAALADRDRRIERLCACKALEAQANTITPELASAIVDALANLGTLFGASRASVIAAILALRPVELRVEEDFWDTPISTPEARLRGMHDTLADWTLALRPVEVRAESGSAEKTPRPRPTWRALADAVKAYLDGWDRPSTLRANCESSLALNDEIAYLERGAAATDEDRALLHAARLRGAQGLDPLRRALADWTLALVASNKENP